MEFCPPATNEIVCKEALLLGLIPNSIKTIIALRKSPDFRNQTQKLLVV